MPVITARKGWLPREGFTADVVQGIIKQTILNPAVTLPLLLLVRYTRKGQDISVNHELAVSRLKTCLYWGIARWVNGYLNRGVLNNWERDSWDWEKELVVITGGSDGIGKLLVHHFATKNVKTVILDIQEPTFELPNNVHYLRLDLSSAADIASVSATLRSTYGNPTILILNAGIANAHTILTTPEPLLERIFAVNTLSHYRLTREFLPAITAANHGAIVTVASLAGFITVPGLVDYCSTKASAVAFHEGLATELRNRYHARKVRTICVCPNFVATKLSEGFENRSKFLSPTLDAQTVAECVFEKVVSGQSGLVVLPKTHEWLACTIRALPFWWQGYMRDDLKGVMVGPEALRKKRDAEKMIGEAGEKVEEEVEETVGKVGDSFVQVAE
ncbi:hypothetical protein MMC30_000809 [Trapelia coarctata]|nr:hypothetical protein [Trapelia coarctata]